MLSTRISFSGDRTPIKLPLPQADIACLSINSSDTLISACAGSHVHVAPCAGDRPTKSLVGHTAATTGCCFSPHSPSTLVSISGSLFVLHACSFCRGSNVYCVGCGVGHTAVSLLRTWRPPSSLHRCRSHLCSCCHWRWGGRNPSCGSRARRLSCSSLQKPLFVFLCDIRVFISTLLRCCRACNGYIERFSRSHASQPHPHRASLSSPTVLSRVEPGARCDSPRILCKRCRCHGYAFSSNRWPLCLSSSHAPPCSLCSCLSRPSSPACAI